VLRISVQALKIGTIAILAGLILLGGARAFAYYRDQAAIEGKYGKKVVVTISSRDDPGEVADKLKDAGLINSTMYFEGLVRVSGKEIEPGSYTLKHGMSSRTIVDLITTEKSKAKTKNVDLTITIPEGWRTEQIAEELDRLGLNGGYEAFMEAVRNYDDSQFDFLADRPDKKSLEGYLFPDTYQFKADTAPEDLIQLMLQNFEQKFDATLRQRAGEMGLSVNEVLIFASLVQREAQVGQEFPLIAGIYLNRFEQGINMESDPTVQFAIGKRGDWWPVPNEDDLFTESPYNTYQNPGLPPTPIANPGMSAITAVLQPTQSDYIYFVASPANDGSHLFAIDPASQDQNINFRNGVADAPAPCSNPWDPGCPLNPDGAAPADGQGEQVPIEQSGG
jgi:UPF0755 protein